MIKRYKWFWKYLTCIISSVLTCGLIGELHWLLLTDYSDKDATLAGIFIGLPLGNIISLIFLNKFIYKKRSVVRYKILGLFLGFVTIICCIVLVDVIGNFGFLIMPIAVSLTFVLCDKTIDN